MFDDLLSGRTKFHNVFHYPTTGWADVGMIAWLVDAAAIVAQQALRDSSYAPYARTMRKICWEESVHIMHGRDVVVTMATGTAAQRAAIQDALERWWGPLMQMHGPRSPREQDRDLHWRIQAKTSEELRQEREGDPMRHGGSVMAPDAELAAHYARELFGRRQESVRLWVVRRADIVDIDDPDLLQPPLDRSYKKPGGYVMRDKLAAAREAAGQPKPKARSR
jgi:phenylacetate-CoA oxygenase PaaH subunit